MKTNASSKTIVTAVENVSNALYDGNVIFRKYPERITKNVLRFTLRTKDANKKGSMVTKSGQRQPKANWQVHQDVMDEIFKLSSKSNIYVDTIYGRQFNTHPSANNEVEVESNEEFQPVAEKEAEEDQQITKDKPEVPTPPKRKYIPALKKSKNTKQPVSKSTTGRKPYTKKNGLPNMSKLIEVIKYAFEHPEVLRKR